ncbi:unnamed protein product [Symbiodinium natans]|uniref:EamA domain-containing protein n=1 Tax=Symbiodinium natans TaxID=878477 RepID=A0A812TEF5_9DINO|nr:unnamed protein product [Symbiodinium natans]
MVRSWLLEDTVRTGLGAFWPSQNVWNTVEPFWPVFLAGGICFYIFGLALGKTTGSEGKTSSTSSPAVSGARTSVLAVSVFALYIISYSLQGLIWELHKLTEASLLVVQAQVVLVSKLLCLSLGAGHAASLGAFWRCFEARNIARYSLPGFCFGFYEVFKMMALLKISAGSVQVLLQFQLIPMVLLRSLTFREALQASDYTLLLALTCGCAGFQYTHDAASGMGVAYTAIAMAFSVLGNVLGEYLLTSAHQEPVVLQNTWSLVSESLAAAIMMLLDRSSKEGASVLALPSWSPLIWTLVVAGALHSLVSTTACKVNGSVAKTIAGNISTVFPTWVVLMLLGVESAYDVPKILFGLVVLTTSATFTLKNEK